MNAPTGNEDFEQPEIDEYFLGGGNFAPTDVEEMEGLYYVTTGYSNLDFVLTARILSFDPFKAAWYDLAFGGKGTGHGQFNTAHGITIPPGKKRLDISDRPNSRIERFTRYAPVGSRSPDAALAELSDRELVELFRQSQPPWTAPEAAYGAR